MTVAFVASALPARFIRAQAKMLKISRIVCASRELQDVFRYAIPADSLIELTSTPRFGGALLSLRYLFQEVRKAEEVIIFHECCWVTLDAILLLIQPRATLFPHVSLAGFNKLPATENKSLLWYVKHFGVIQCLLLVFLRRYFEFYDMPSDGGNGREAVAALRYEKLRDIQIHTCAKTAEILAGSGRGAYRGGRLALIVCAREPVPDSAQLALYRDACDRLIAYGYTIYLKDHPRKSARLNFSYSCALVIPPHVPADLCDIGPRFVIGICSSALASYGEKALSLVRLLPISEVDAQSRIAHLRFLPGGGEIRFVQNWADFGQIITG